LGRAVGGVRRVRAARASAVGQRLRPAWPLGRRPVVAGGTAGALEHRVGAWAALSAADAGQGGAAAPYAGRGGVAAVGLAVARRGSGRPGGPVAGAGLQRRATARGPGGCAPRDALVSQRAAAAGAAAGARLPGGGGDTQGDATGRGQLAGL